MITVFYGQQVYAQYEGWGPFSKARKEYPNEITQGAYVYVPISSLQRDTWYRLDLTPVLIEDVPAELKAWILLLD